VDDFGLKPLRPPSSEDWFDIIAERYERGALIVTSNRALNEWPDLFGDPLLASAGLDRLFHNAHAITITGNSYPTRSRQLPTTPNTELEKMAASRARPQFRNAISRSFEGGKSATQISPERAPRFAPEQPRKRPVRSA